MDKKKLGRSAEDYLESIYLFAKEKDNVRTSDIASFLEHKPPSVTEMLQKLKENGLVKYEPYRGVALTHKGRKLAEEVTRKHNVLAEFLKVLGVDEKTAEADACEIEHVVESRTMEKLRKFVRFVQEAPEKPTWLEHYRYFVKTGKHPECKCRKES